MKVYLKTKKVRVFAIAIFLTLLSVIFFTFTLNTFATSTELESSLRNASGTTSNEVVADSNYFFVASIDGPSWTGGSANKDDRHDVVRVFTFFDKSKVSVAGYYTHDGYGDPTVDKTKTSLLNPRGEPNSSGDYVYGASLNTNASDDNAYAAEVGSVDYNRAIPAKRDSDPTRGAQTYDTDAAGGEYHGKPLYHIQSLDITTEPATGKRNPCKEVYDEAIATTGGFTSLRAATASDLGCVGFERFRGYDEGGGDFFAPSLGENYPSNSDLYGLELKIKSGTTNGDTDLISVATSDGYNVSGTTTEPPITETVKTLTVVDNVFKIKTIEVINSTDGGETGTFNVGVEFLSTVSGFAEDADFRFVENGTTTKAGDVTRIRLLDPFYLDVPYDGIDTNRGTSQYGQLWGRYFVVTVVPGQGLSGNYQFEIHPDTDIDTYVGDSKYNPSDADTYKLSVSVFSTFLFSDLKISDSTVTSSFAFKDYTLAGNLKNREFFSRSNQIDVEFIANSNNGGGHPLPADFALKESASFDPNDPTTDCSNNTPTFSNITPDTSTTNLYSMTITLPTGKYNCRLSYSQTISGTKTEKTQPIVFDGAQYTSNVLGSHTFNTFYINTEPRVVSFNPLPATDVKTSSRSHDGIASTSTFDDLNYFNSSIGSNVDVYDELIDQATDCDAALSWSTKTKTDDDFTTDNENQNGKYICVRTYDDFVTNNLSADSLYSYDKLLVENIDTTDPTVTDLSPKNSGTQAHDFEVKVSFNEDVKNINIADFTFVENDNTTGAVVTSSAGAITKVEAFDVTFLTSTGASTTDSTPIEGQYFLVSVTANDDMSTTTDITYEFQIDTNISDIAGNTVGSSAANTTLAVDIDTQTNPTVSVDITNTGVSGVLGKEFVVDVSFSEEVVNVDAADFVFLETSGGTSAGSITNISAFEDSDFTIADTTSGTSRYYQVTVTAIDDLVSITNGYSFRILNVVTSAIADKAGNLLDIGASTDDVRLNFLISNIDTTKPTATIAAITDTKNAAFTVQVSFSETVNNVNINDFELTDGSTDVASITKVEAFNSTFLNSTGSSTTTSTLISGQYFVVTVTPDSSLEGSYTFKVLATTTDTIADALSNLFVEEDVNSQIQVDIDTTDPTATIEAITDTQNGAFTVNVTFNEEVTGVDIGDFRFVLENTSTNLSSITKVEAFDETFNTSTGSSTTNSSTISGQYFVVSLTPSNDIETNSTTTYSFEVFPDSASTITDTAGNTLSGIASANISVDTKKPTATVDVSGEQEKTFAVNVTFSEEVENVSIDDFTFIQTGTANSAGTITGVEKHSDSNFNDTSPSTTTQTGQYFKVLVEAINDIETDSTTTFTFNVIANTDQTSLIKDTSENTFQTDLNSSTLVDINTKSDPTVSSVSAPSGTQIDAFNVNVTFSEPVSNVDIGDFRLVLKDANTSTDPTFGTIVVEKHSDSTFSDTSPTITDTTTTQLSGTYFKVKVTPQDDLLTDTLVTEYVFQVIDDEANLSSIEDGASNTLEAQGLSGIIRSTTNINIDTVHPKTTEVSLTVAGTQETTFDVDVTFSESVNNVDISDFEFIEIDDTDPANTITSSVGTITKVEAHSDSNFNDTSPSTTTDATTLSGTYFKISIKPNEDIEGTYTFKVLSGSIVDDATNTFETSANDSLSVAVNTARKPTLTSVSDADPSTTLKTGDFEINVEFSEVVYGVNKSDFQFTDGSTSVGTITQVEAVNFDFDSKNPNVITTDDTTISGRYFIVSVDPDEGLLTESAVTYTFEVLSSEGITDGVPNSFDGTGGETTTLDVAVDTLDPLIISSEIVNSTLVLTSSLTLGDASTSSLTGDKSGGFTVTGSDSTVYTITSVVVSGTTITITLTSPTGTDPTVRGTYSYRKNSTLNINTSSNNALADTTNPTAYGVVFDLDLDLSGDFIVAEDALFLYLYKQKENPFTKDALERYLNISSTYDNTIANIDAAILDNSLDLDLSGDFIVAEDALFLYLYKQKENPFTKDALERYLNISSTYDNTIANIDALITAVNQ